MVNQAVKKQNQPALAPAKKEPSIKAILEERLEIVAKVARTMAGIPDMPVNYGAPLGGSYCDTQAKTTTFDPVQVLEDLGFAKFVAGHEGAHAAITLSPIELGLSTEVADSLYSQIGFGYIQNVHEDGTVNDWQAQTCPALEPEVVRAYDKMFKSPDAVLSTPEVDALAQQMGRYPLFAQYGSEVLRDWHDLRCEFGYNKSLADREVLSEAGRYSHKIDDKVRKVLEKTTEASRTAIATIPAGGCRDRQEILTKHRERFTRIAEIYQEILPLIEEDRKQEELRQQVNQQMQQGQSGGQQQQSGQGQSGQGQSGGQSSQSGQGQSSSGGQSQAGQQGQSSGGSGQQGQPSSGQSQPGQGQAGQPSQSGKGQSAGAKPQSGQASNSAGGVPTQMPAMPGVSSDAQKDISEAIDKGLQNQAEQVAEQLQQGLDQIQKAQELKEQLQQKQSGQSKSPADKKDLDQQIADLETGIKELQKKLKEEISQSLETKQDAGQTNSIAQKLKDQVDQATDKKSPQSKSSKKQSQEVKDEIKDALAKKGLEEGVLPIDPTSLKDSTLKELKKQFDSLSKQVQEQIKKEAEQVLKRFEDKFNQAIRGQLDSNPAPSHQEMESNNQDSGQSSKGTGSGELPAQNSGALPEQIDAKEIQRQQAALNASRMKLLDPYDQVLEDLGNNLGLIINRLRRFWYSSEGKHEEDQPDGVINVQRGMELETDPNLIGTEFDVFHAAEDLSVSFVILLDASGSMDYGAGEKRAGSFRGQVICTELAEAFKVPNEVYAFEDNVTRLKNFEQSVRDPETKANLAEYLRLDGGTQDAHALKAAYNSIKGRKEELKIIFIFSDAQSGEAKNVGAVMKQIKSERKAIVIHFGIGAGTSDGLGLYSISHGNLGVLSKGEDLDLSDETVFEGKLVAVMKDILLKPEKYKKHLE